MSGLKRVSQRRNDALSRVGWAQLESLLAIHYRGQGYQVEHVGTGATGTRFDGGIDLKLRRDGEYVVVQCKHWNAMKVTHNAVHELLGIMVNEGATGAIVVTSGEFSKAAIEAGARQGRIQLIDGEELRAMLGPVPEPVVEMPDGNERWKRGYVESGAVIDEPQALVFGEARTSRRNEPSMTRSSPVFPWWLVALVGAMVFALLVHALLERTAGSAGRGERTVQAAPHGSLPRPSGEAPSVMDAPLTDAQRAEALRVAADACREVIDWQSGTYIDHCAKAAAPKAPTAAEIRESQRKADEAAAVIAPNTPAM